jgi:hypothetical protein
MKLLTTGELVNLCSGELLVNLLVNSAGELW